MRRGVVLDNEGPEVMLEEMLICASAEILAVGEGKVVVPAPIDTILATVDVSESTKAETETAELLGPVEGSLCAAVASHSS